MINKLCFFIGCIVLTFGSTAQTYPDLSDSILLYKFSNSTDYQLIISRDSVETFYFPDSTIKAKGRYFKGKRIGLWSSFYESGKLHTYAYITDSSFYGKWQFYYENGVRKAKGKFKYTPDEKDSTLMVLKMSGKWKFWNDQGELIYKTNFSTLLPKAQSKYGKYIEYYDSGKIKVRGEYYKGSRIGNWKSYYESGVKKSTSYYQFKPGEVDYPMGNWQYWDKKGRLIKKEVYKDGKLIETITY